MIEARIINDSFEWDNSISNKCYRVYAEDENGKRSTDFILKYVTLNIKLGKYFCGKTCFYDIPLDAINSQFVFKFDNYFDKFETYFYNPNKALLGKIEQFNKAQKVNPMYAKYGKPLLDSPEFSLGYLIQNSELVIVIEKHFSEYGPNLLFFASDLADSKKYIVNYFKSENIDLIDKSI